MRIGIGYDIHRFSEHRALVLGGCHFEHPQGLAGHSDADCLTHAIMDALLGAAGCDDIGVYFPDNEARFKDISSVILLEKVATIIAEQGYTIGNIDSVVIAEEPKINPHKNAMRAKLAQALKIDPAQIMIKATTSEGIGMIGRKEGLAAYAVVLLNEK